jgi:hypothetical protein
VLSRHPEIYLTDIKEHHFWDVRRISLQEYRDRFDGKGQRRAGDITPAYAALSPAVIQEVYEFNPAARVFYVIRNPIRKAWSGIFRLIQDNYPEKPAGKRRQWYFKVATRLKDAGVMDYETRIRSWRAVFGERFLVLLHDEIETRPHDSIARILSHVGVAQIDFFDSQDLSEYVPSYGVRGKQRWRTTELPPFLVEQLGGKEFTGTPPVPAFLVDHLQDIYTPVVESLSRYLQRDLSHWLRA